MAEKANILIVDDDESTRKSLSLIFKKKGYETHTAGTGKEALAAAKEKSFNAALLDIRLPDIQGIELIKPLREIHPDIAIIMATGFASLDTSVRALNEGAVGYITKPLNMDEVLAKVSDVLEKQRLKLENRRLYEEIHQELIERKKAEEALRESEEKHRTLFETMAQGVAYQDCDGKITSANPAAERILGLTLDQMQGRASVDPRWKAIHEDGSDFPGETHPSMVALRTGKSVYDTVMGVYNPIEDNYRWVKIDAIPRFLSGQEKPFQVYATFNDITKRLETEKRIFHLNRVLKSIRSINQLIVKEKDKKKLLEEACHILSEVSGYYFVWIGMIEEDHKRVVPAAHYGYENGYLTKVKMTWDDEMTGMGPTGTAIKTGKTSVLRDITEPRFAPWRKEAEKRGYKSSIAIPISHEKNIYGVLTVCADRTDLFDDEEINLLEEVVEDIGYALSTIESEEKRKKAEEALRESEDLLNEVGSMARVGGWQLFAETKEVQWTKETYRIHEVDEGERIRLPEAILFFDEPNRSVLAEALRRGMDKGEPFDLELPFTSAKGRHLWTRAIGRAVTTNGRVVKLTGTFQDITEQKKLERERDTTIKVLRSINTTYDVPELIKSLTSVLHESFGLETIGIRLRDGEDFPYFETKGFPEEFVELERKLCAYDESGQLLRNGSGNPVLECMCGNVIQGRFDPSKSFFTDNGSFWTNGTTELLAGTTEEDRQGRTRNRCNGEGYESVALVPLRFADETFGLIQFNDRRKGCFTPEMISLFERLADNVAMALSQRLGEVKTRESEEKWRNLFESSKDVIYLSTLEGRFIDINRAGEELFGYTQKKLAKIELVDIYKDPRDRDVLLRKIGQEGFVRDYEVVLKKNNGELVDCLITATARRDRDGNINGIQGIIRDISEQKKMGERIFQMEKLSSLGGILSGVAHELNNPLTAIIGNAQLLTRKEIPSEYKEKLEVIQKESIRCTKIVSGLLAFAREHKPERRILNINDIIMESHKLREYELRVDNITVKLDLSPDLPETAADPFQFQQVFINLINNAHDALINKSGGRLTISSRHIGEKIRIEFTDNGTGIPDENRKKIFDPFFTTKEVGKGTGLGLSIIYGIVAEHGGMIDVESKVGEYTKFIIELPVVKHVEPVVTRERKAVNKPIRDKTILIVDDEDSLREMITETLTGEGYLVESTNNGQKALEILKKGKFDAVISDIKMPMMGGKELYVYLVNDNPDLAKRIIFITGDVLGQETQQFLNITGNRYIEKPFEIQDLLAVLSEVLSNG